MEVELEQQTGPAGGQEGRSMWQRGCAHASSCSPHMWDGKGLVVTASLLGQRGLALTRLARRQPSSRA
jgi:hypothetical protein